MSAREITNALVEHITSGQYGFILANYANPDMVGHTGVLEAAIKAVEFWMSAWPGSPCRAGSGRIRAHYCGPRNLEIMSDSSTGQPHTAHTNRPRTVYRDQGKSQSQTRRPLADVAPTVLDLLGIEKPR